jgi:hypothetical protein
MQDRRPAGRGVLTTVTDIPVADVRRNRTLVLRKGSGKATDEREFYLTDLAIGGVGQRRTAWWD